MHAFLIAFAFAVLCFYVFSMRKDWDAGCPGFDGQPNPQYLPGLSSWNFWCRRMRVVVVCVIVISRVAFLTFRKHYGRVLWGGLIMPGQ
jgi:hypothetical protein